MRTIGNKGIVLAALVATTVTVLLWRDGSVVLRSDQGVTEPKVVTGILLATTSVGPPEKQGDTASLPPTANVAPAMGDPNAIQPSAAEAIPPTASAHPIGVYDSTYNAPYDPSLKNVGFRSPDDALQSQLWAISTGDVSVLSQHIALDPKGKKAAKKVFAELPSEFQEKFGSVMGMIAFMQIADSPPVAAWSTTMRTSDNDEVIFTVRMNTTDGAVRNRVMRFVPTDNGWSRIVTGNLVLTWQKLLTESGTSKPVN